MKMYDNGGIAGQLHMNRQGYQWGGPGGYSPGTPIDYQPKSKPIKSPILDLYELEDTPVIAGGELINVEGDIRPQKTKEEQVKEFVKLPEKLQDKKEADLAAQEEELPLNEFGQKIYPKDEAPELDLPGKIFEKSQPPLGNERMTKKGNEISAGMDILKIASEIKVLYPKRKISTVGDLKKFINDTRTVQSIGFGEVVKLTNAIDDASSSMRLTSNTKLGDITHFVDSNMTQLNTEQELGPVKLTSSLTFQDGKLQEGAKTTLNVPIDFSKLLFAKYDHLKNAPYPVVGSTGHKLDVTGGVSTDNLENLYADLGVNLNLNDLDLGLTSKYSADDRKDLGLNIGLNKEFESGLGSGILTPSFSYNILEPDKSKFDIGYQHEFDETIPYVGEGTLKIGGELDKEGQNYGIVFKKKLKPKPKILGKYAKGGRVSLSNGGLANILKV